VENRHKRVSASVRLLEHAEELAQRFRGLLGMAVIEVFWGSPSRQGDESEIDCILLRMTFYEKGTHLERSDQSTE
jgi:hypothetical protein